MRPLDEGVRRVLDGLGLTAYESVVYLSLVEGGVITASLVSESAGVPFSKVYEVLNRLEQKGWVDVERGRPSRYFAKPPLEAFEAAQREVEVRMRGWERVVAGELQPLYEKRELREKPDIWILRGETGVLSKLQDMLSSVEDEVMIAVPAFAMDLATRALPLLTGLSLGKAKVLVMVAGESEGWGLSGLMRNVEVRERGSLFGGGVIVDGREALLFLGEEKPSLVVWSNHVGLVKFAKDYFRYLWESSKKAA